MPRRQEVPLPSLYYGTHSTFKRLRRNEEDIKKRRLHIRPDWPGKVVLVKEYPNGIYIDKRGVPQPTSNKTMTGCAVVDVSDESDEDSSVYEPTSSEEEEEEDDALSDLEEGEDRKEEDNQTKREEKEDEEETTTLNLSDSSAKEEQEEEEEEPMVPKKRRKKRDTFCSLSTPKFDEDVESAFVDKSTVAENNPSALEKEKDKEKEEEEESWILKPSQGNLEELIA